MLIRKDYNLLNWDLLKDNYNIYITEQINIPGNIGKYTNDLAYDSDAFKLTNKFSRSNDPPNRKVLEPSFEAIVDAG